MVLIYVLVTFKSWFNHTGSTKHGWKMKSQMFKILKVPNNALRFLSSDFVFPLWIVLTEKFFFSSNSNRISFDLKRPFLKVSDPFILKTKYMATPRQSTLVFDLFSSHSPPGLAK